MITKIAGSNHSMVALKKQCMVGTCGQEGNEFGQLTISNNVKSDTLPTGSW